MKREERLDFIATLITRQEVKTQEELVALLLSANISVTQATISRDIKSLALVKVPATSGGYRYALPAATETAQPRLSRQDLMSDAIASVKLKREMLALRTEPGTTSLVKTHLLEQYPEELFSIITDDDSILAIFENEKLAEEAYVLLKN